MFMSRYGGQISRKRCLTNRLCSLTPCERSRIRIPLMVLSSLASRGNAKKRVMAPLLYSKVAEMNKYWIKHQLSFLKSQNILTSHEHKKFVDMSWHSKCWFQKDSILCSTGSQFDAVKYEEIANITLDLLADFFETLSDDGLCLEDFDVQLASGVLTINVGGEFGTYVINKQTPNRQIWLSSPTSGPKRYDYIDGHWIYSHTGEGMTELLSREFSEMLGKELDFSVIEYTPQR